MKTTGLDDGQRLAAAEVASTHIVRSRSPVPVPQRQSTTVEALALAANNAAHDGPGARSNSAGAQRAPRDARAAALVCGDRSDHGRPGGLPGPRFRSADLGLSRR